MDRHVEHHRFPGALENMLAGRLERPSGRPRAYAVFAHCFTCSKDFTLIRRIGRALVRRGIAILSFDFGGLGQSEGDFAATTFSSNLEDLVRAAAFLRENFHAPQLLIGHSLGGTASLAAAHRIPEVKAVVTIGAPSTTAHLKNLLVGMAPELARRDAAVTIAEKEIRVGAEFVEDLDNHDLTRAIASLDRALLVLHSPADSVVSIDEARRIFQAARHPKSFISLDGADHLLTEHEGDAAFAGDIIATWAYRYIEPDTAAERTAARDDHHEEVVVRARGEGLTQDITVGNHRILADEPIAQGGRDLGMNPYELLLAGLGACTSMTLRMYADRKRWPLRSIEVRLRHAKVHASDCAACETREGMVDRIERTVLLEGPLSAEQRARLLEIADKCPVHRTLTSETSIVTREADTA